jgi:hypothetical protein
MKGAAAQGVMCGRAPTARRIRGIRRALHARRSNGGCTQEKQMNNIIYIVGFVVVVLFVLGFLGLR